MDDTEPRRRGPYAKTADRRREILRTAMTVFAESGFRGSSIREIATRVGMTDGGVLHHFGGKGNLLLAVLKEREDDDRVLASSQIATDPFDRLIVERNTQRRGIVRLFATLSAEATDPEHPAHNHFVERYAAIRFVLTERFRMFRCAERLHPDMDPELAARLTIAVMDGLQIQWLLDPTMDMCAAYDDFVRHYFGHQKGGHHMFGQHEAEA